jgi:8-oxo-dGTP diphosphatase
MSAPSLIRRLVGIFPVNARQELLLQLRDDRPDLSDPNTWSTLGGQVESGETPEAAAVRELLEECGRTAERLIRFDVADRRDSAGQPIRVYSFAAAVDWSLDDLILGEGQGLAWLAPSDLEVLVLNPVIAGDIREFARSPIFRQLAAAAPRPHDRARRPLPPGFIGLLDVQAGDLIACSGATAGFAAQLRSALPAGARLTASPAAHERPDVALWWPETSAEPFPPAKTVWVAARDRAAKAHAVLTASGMTLRETHDTGQEWLWMRYERRRPPDSA